MRTVSPHREIPARSVSGRSGEGKEAGFAGRGLFANLFALGDQAVVSGLNFLIVMLLGRFCTSEVLGNYILGFTLISLVVTIQDALILTPFTVFSQRLEPEQRALYAGSTLLHALVLAGVLALGLAAAAGGLAAAGTAPHLAPVLRAVAVVAPLHLLREFCRRFGFAQFWMGEVFRLDALVGLVLAVALTALILTGGLTAVTAHLAAGLAAGLVGGAWLLLAQRSFRLRRDRLADDWRRNWQQGRWLLGGQFTGVAHGYIIQWLLALMAGTEATGVYSACLYVVMLCNPFLNGLSSLLGVHAARAFGADGKPGVRRVQVRGMALLTGGMLIFSLLVVLFSTQLLRLFYGGHYQGQEPIVNLLAVTVLVSSLGMGAEQGLRALARAEIGFTANLIGLGITIMAALFLLPVWGIFGAACGYLLGTAINAALRLFALVRLLSEPDAIVEGA